MDGLENTQDVATSGDETETSYSVEQIAEIKRKATSDALADAGRARAEAQKFQREATSALARLEKMQKSIEDAEREANRDNPEALNAIDERRRRREAEAKLEEAEAKLSEASEARELLDKQATEARTKSNVQDVATRLGVDSRVLSKLALLTDGSVEAIEAEAKVLPKVSEPKSPILADSGRGSGETTLKPEQVAKMSPEERFARADEIAKMPMGYTSLAK